MKWCLGAAAVLAACANTSGDTSRTCAPLTVTEPSPAAGWDGSVFTVVMENKSQSDIFGNPDAPYVNSLVQQSALALGYHDPFVHPSEPNYLWMAAGENFGVLDDDDPSSHPITSTSHIADQLELAGLSWKTYQQSMGAPCGITSHGPYAAKHDPFVYFVDITHDPARCDAHVVDYSQLATDIASGQVPKYAFITPDLDHDMHDGSIAAGDAWLAQELPKIFATDAFQHGGVLFLMWDEGSGLLDPGDDPPFLVISPNANTGTVSRVSYDTSAYLKTVQRILGVDELPCAAAPERVPVMADLFGIAM